ncbi:MAG: hypothetical protein BGN89_11635 [Alphaproteobacteria bacterium 64-6]|nr:MAG: hypothetical protein BGN89_11635 [Alphaproteobacteria bacterium 64-6]
MRCIEIDMRDALPPEDWLAHLSGFDAVINCVGCKTVMPIPPLSRMPTGRGLCSRPANAQAYERSSIAARCFGNSQRFVCFQSCPERASCKSCSFAI